MTTEQQNSTAAEASLVELASKLTEAQLLEAQRIVSDVIKDARKSDAALLGGVLVALAINTHRLRNDSP
jgi:hypothetical protein